MCETCKATGLGVVGSWQARRAQEAHDRKIREETIKMMSGGRAAAQPTLTEKAQTVLVVVGGIVLLASASLIIHVLLITLAMLFAAVSASAVLVTARRRRLRARLVIPAPLPPAGVRTMVTGVMVQAIGQDRAQRHAVIRGRGESGVAGANYRAHGAD
jgi:hypothetical protein